MKTHSSLPITVALAAIFASQALALEAPADDAPPPPTQGRKQALPRFDLTEPAAEPLAEAAFLGVVTGILPPLLTEHLALKTGEGVLIRSLVPGSPAEQAGIAINDVVTKISGESVGSPKEISARIATHKPGESVKFEFIHKGQRLTKDITLGNKPNEPARPQAEPLAQLNLDGFPEELADRVRDAIAGNIGDLNLDEDAALLPPQVGDAMQKLQQNRLGLQATLGKLGESRLMLDAMKLKLRTSLATSTMMMTDDKGCVETQASGGSTEVTVRDPSGEVTWRGPWNTVQDKAAAPEDVRKRVEALK
jgi:serine protease Do